jgi:hypothetical protein
MAVVHVLCMPQRQSACLVVHALECGCSFIVIIALCVCTCNFELNVLCQKFIKLMTSEEGAWHWW